MPIVQKIVRLAANAPAHYKQATRAVHSIPLSKAAQITLRIQEKKDHYTSGDLIEGEAILELSEEIDVAEITLKYKVEEITCVRHPRSTRYTPSSDFEYDTADFYSRRALKRQQRLERRQLRDEQRHDRVNKDAVYRSASRIYCKEQRIFPSEQEGAVIHAKKLTLAPGTHRFSFSIRLAGHKEDNYKVLPPSFSDGISADITHALKATVKRPSSFKQNIRCEVPIHFSPAANTRGCEVSRVVTKSLDINGAQSHTAHTISSTAAIPEFAKIGSNFPISLGIFSEGNMPLSVVEIVGEIVSHTTIKASSFTKCDQQAQVFFTRREFTETGTSLDLSESFQNCLIPRCLTPSFQSKYVTLNHLLRIHIRFALAFDKARSHKITLERSIPVLGANSFTEAPPLGSHDAVYENPQDRSSFLSQAFSCCALEENHSCTGSQTVSHGKGESDGMPPCYA